jgi:hypothetical protein
MNEYSNNVSKELVTSPAISVSERIRLNNNRKARNYYNRHRELVKDRIRERTLEKRGKLDEGLKMMQEAVSNISCALDTLSEALTSIGQTRVTPRE